MAATPSSTNDSREGRPWHWVLLLLLLLVWIGWWYFSPAGTAGLNGIEPGRGTGIKESTPRKSGSASSSNSSWPFLPKRRSAGDEPASSAPGETDPGHAVSPAGSSGNKAMVSLQEMGVVKVGALMNTFGKEQLTPQILENAVQSSAEARGIRFVFSRDVLTSGDSPMLLSTRGLTDLTEEVQNLLTTRYKLKPEPPRVPKPEPRRALTKAGK
jgi:hypothetical protein